MQINPGNIAKNLRQVALWLCLSAIGLICLSFFLPFIVSHTGEQQMIDAPGILYQGVCCIEAPWHFFQRLIWFPIGPVLLLFSAVAAVLALLLKKRSN